MNCIGKTRSATCHMNGTELTWLGSLPLSMVSRAPSARLSASVASLTTRGLVFVCQSALWTYQRNDEIQPEKQRVPLRSKCL
jgi:hypothetical protein